MKEVITVLGAEAVAKTPGDDIGVGEDKQSYKDEEPEERRQNAAPYFVKIWTRAKPTFAKAGEP